MTRLLALIPGGISEQLLFFPSLAALTPQISRIDVVVEPQAQDAYQILPLVNRVVSFDFDGRKGLADWSNLFGKIRELEYDAVITTSRDGKIRFFLWLLGIAKRAGFKGGFSDFLMSNPVAYDPKKPLVESYGELLQPFGLTLGIPAPLPIQIHASNQAWADQVKQSLGIGQAQPFLLLYDIDSESYGYPKQDWKAIVDGLRERQPTAQVALLQYGQNQTWVEAVRQRCDNLKIVNAPKLGQAVAMIDNASWLIATDSVPLYVGAGTQTSVIGLLGPTNPHPQLLQGDRCQVLRAASGQLKDISPIQVLEALN